VDEAIRLATEAEVGMLVLFHHSPGRTDDELDELAASVTAPMPVVLARQGHVLDVPMCVQADAAIAER
jgi:ribonuclease BN (tRNA processing enzyme)